MPLSNQEYLYDRLPSRYRAADADEFLKRYLTFVGETLDGWDETFDAFSQSIASPSAESQWVAFWLDVLFGWSWFPWWFTLAEKRRLYGHFGQHLGRRGTRRGIELWLADFGIVARVHTRTAPYGEFVWGEASFAIPEPLHLIVEILYLQQAPTDMCFWDTAVWGESFYTSPRPMFTEQEIIDLIRYVQPQSQEVTIVWRNVDQIESPDTFWETIQF